MKILGVYKITNNVTGEFYIGSSRNIMQRWAIHKSPSTWKKCPNNRLYLDFQSYGLENFGFEIIEETDDLKNREQYFIDLLKPTYNANRAFGHDLERYRLSSRRSTRRYQKSEKGKNIQKEYYSRLCEYNGETLTLAALKSRFSYANIPNPTAEARKYLIAGV